MCEIPHPSAGREGVFQVGSVHSVAVHFVSAQNLGKKHAGDHTKYAISLYSGDLVDFSD